MEGDVTVRAAENLEATVRLQTSTGNHTVDGFQLQKITRDNGNLEGELNNRGPQSPYVRILAMSNFAL